MRKNPSDGDSQRRSAAEPASKSKRATTSAPGAVGGAAVPLTTDVVGLAAGAVAPLVAMPAPAGAESAIAPLISNRIVSEIGDDGP